MRKSGLKELYALLKRKSVTVITPADGEYPDSLKEIYDPPLALFRKGRPLEKGCTYIAVVGMRKATHYGLRAAEEIIGGLCGDFAVVSGMAAGIDAAAHKAAMDRGFYTVAVLGTGPDYIYPSVNRKLYGEILENGTVISEYLPGTGPSRYSFPRRNRIISGMSKGVLVVECGKKSGALITAGFALEQGRDVFAVPGSILARSSAGTNGLIRDGAFPVIEAEDIMLRWGTGSPGKAPKNKSPALLTDGEKEVISHLSVDEPFTIEELAVIMKTGRRPEKIAAVMTALVIKGVVLELAGKRFVLKEEVDI